MSLLGLHSASVIEKCDSTTTSIEDALSPGLRQGNASAFAALMEPIATPLLQVECLLRDTLASQVPDVNSILEYVSEVGGKHLRPALTLLSAMSIGKITEETIRLAVVVEMVHMATLVHDDVLDGASIRRHRPTVHTKWNVPTSILSGDWLFTQAYHLASLGESTLPGRWISQAARHVCEGEIRQNASAGNYRLNQPEYLEILAAKTGRLCAVSCAIGAWSAGGSPTSCEIYEAYGLDLGIAFQIHDDWLDVWGSERNTGKSRGADLAAGKPTLPLIRLLQTIRGDEKRAWDEASDPSTQLGSDMFARLVANHDASRYTRNTARQFALRASHHLGKLPENDARRALQRLALGVVDREA